MNEFDYSLPRARGQTRESVSRKTVPNLGKCLADFASRVTGQIADILKGFVEAVGQTIRPFIKKTRNDYETWMSDPVLQERPTILIGQVRQPEHPSALPKFIRWPLAIVVIVLLFLRPATAGDVSFSLIETSIEVNIENPQIYVNYDTLNQNCSVP